MTSLSLASTAESETQHDCTIRQLHTAEVGPVISISFPNYHDYDKVHFYSVKVPCICVLASPRCSQRHLIEWSSLIRQQNRNGCRWNQICNKSTDKQGDLCKKKKNNGHKHRQVHGHSTKDSRFLTNQAIKIIKNVLLCCIRWTVCHWGEEYIIMQKISSSYSLTFSAHRQPFLGWYDRLFLRQFPLHVTFTRLFLLFVPLLSVLPVFLLPDPFTTPFPHLLSSLHPSIHLPIYAQGGLALFLSDVWKCQQCEGTVGVRVWGEGERQACEAVESLWSWTLTDRQTQWEAKGLLWACLWWLNTWPPATLQSFSHFPCLTLSFLSVSSELPPGWEKIDDPVYGVYYVE